MDKRHVKDKLDRAVRRMKRQVEELTDNTRDQVEEMRPIGSRAKQDTPGTK